jgi:hypothetical protein
MSEQDKPKVAPGECVPWEQFEQELPEIQGNEQLVRRIHQDIDALANTYIWQCLLSF